MPNPSTMTFNQEDMQFTHNVATPPTFGISDKDLKDQLYLKQISELAGSEEDSSANLIVLKMAQR